MDTATHVRALDNEGHLLLDTAARAGLEAAVPSCPEWQVRDLLRHIGQVHRLANSYVSTGRTTPPGEDDHLSSPPGDEQLLDWVRAGHADLVRSLQHPPEDLQCWSFLPAPSPLAFWARRQAHEIAMHRADAQLAAGDTPSFDAAFAADGIDELLVGFFARPGRRFVADPPVRLGLRAADTGDAWTFTIGPDGRQTTREPGDADCVVTGTAATLYQLVWNRGDRDGCTVEGDETVLDLYRDKAAIKFG